ILVVGGTFTVALIAYRPSELKNLFYIALKIIKANHQSSIHVVNQLTTIAKQKPAAGTYTARFRDVHPFISDGLRLLDNQFSYDEIESILTSMMQERKAEFQREIEIVNTLAKYPPAFGMVGTVLGLVSMLGSIQANSPASTIGPSMAIALATTFYGLVLSNYILTPLADSLSNRLRSEMAERRIIVKGILLLEQGQDAVFIEESLNAHLLPHQRALEIIREKLITNQNIHDSNKNTAPETSKSKDLTTKESTSHGEKQFLDPRIPEGLSLMWQKFKSNPLVKIESSGDFVTLQIAQVEFFNRGSINLTEQGKDQIKRVFEVIEQNKKDILVEIIGHSDNIPVKKRVTLNGMSYSTNLELSTLRAMNVMSYMNGLGMPLENILIAGHSNSKPIEELQDSHSSNTNQKGFERRVSFTIRLKK
ncbi:MAG: MotA/TolQ/ExbB proton channel family protein, partial [Proteobacteria bacterium]|nr:MotA/TolQ/ExbB proton channel family protein [Pseudomonadota bacterium]